MAEWSNPINSAEIKDRHGMTGGSSGKTKNEILQSELCSVVTQTAGCPSVGLTAAWRGPGLKRSKTGHFLRTTEQVFRSVAFLRFYKI